MKAGFSPKTPLRCRNRPERNYYAKKKKFVQSGISDGVDVVISHPNLSVRHCFERLADRSKRAGGKKTGTDVANYRLYDKLAANTSTSTPMMMRYSANGANPRLRT